MAPEPIRKLDYSYLQTTPNDGNRYELVEGELFVSAAPNLAHQRISGRLERQLEDYFHPRKLGEVFHAPTDVILTSHDVFEPDLLVVSKLEHMSLRGIEQPPLIVVEILSPSTTKVDRGVKYRRYAELGIRHYWIVDPDVRRIECYRLDGNKFKMLLDANGDATLQHPDWEGFVIDLAAIWRSPLA